MAQLIWGKSLWEWGITGFESNVSLFVAACVVMVGLHLIASSFCGLRRHGRPQQRMCLSDLRLGERTAWSWQSRHAFSATETGISSVDFSNVSNQENRDRGHNLGSASPHLYN